MNILNHTIYIEKNGVRKITVWEKSVHLHMTRNSADIAQLVLPKELLKQAYEQMMAEEMHKESV
jgi:hypothetical protein